MNAIPPELATARERFLSLVADLRPELHRYCSRLVGSAVDGEDVVQALAKAFYAMSLSPEMVSKSQRRGKGQVAPYFGNYARENVRLSVGRAEGHDVIGVHVPAGRAEPAYIIALELEGDRVGLIRDWRHVPYLMKELPFEPRTTAPVTQEGDP